MYMRTFFIALDKALKKDHADLEFEFYLSRRLKFVHMGLDVPLISIEKHQEINKFIEKYWNDKKTDDKFDFTSPRLISATKFKFDYIIFHKKL